MKKQVFILGGGTVSHISNHLALCVPAYGTTAMALGKFARQKFTECDVNVALSRLAGDPLSNFETNDDLQKYVDHLKGVASTKVIFFNVACVDFRVEGGGKYKPRLDSSERKIIIAEPDNKIIKTIRNGRKDIFLIGFKSTCGAEEQEMYLKGLYLCKSSSANLVLVNDTINHTNMIITPEEAAYHVTKDREEALKNLVEMAWYRSQLTFTRSTVVDGTPVPWNDSSVPESLRKVVDYCRGANAYKPFNGGTVGHFAVKLSDNQFLTSIRKSDFNKLDKIGLVKVETDGPDTVLAYGAKPSVGGQSQRTVFKDHVGYNCIVHFHCPLREIHPDKIPVVSQREVECGSHQCGENTSAGLEQFGNLKAVMLNNHGPNIIFNDSIDPQEVINFIEANFDLSKKTGGYHL